MQKGKEHYDFPDDIRKEMMRPAGPPPYIHRNVDLSSWDPKSQKQKPVYIEDTPEYQEMKKAFSERPLPVHEDPELPMSWEERKRYIKDRLRELRPTILVILSAITLVAAFLLSHHLR